MLMLTALGGPGEGVKVRCPAECGNRLHHAVLRCTYVIRIQNGVDRDCSLIARLIEGWDEQSCRLISRSVSQKD